MPLHEAKLRLLGVSVTIVGVMWRWVNKMLLMQSVAWMGATVSATCLQHGWSDHSPRSPHMRLPPVTRH